MPLPSDLQSFCWEISWMLWEFPFMFFCCFSLVAFNIFKNFNLIFISLKSMCLMCFSFGLSCLGLSALLGPGWLIPFPAREVFSYYRFKYFLKMLSQRSLRLSSFLFILFILFPGSDLHHLVFQAGYLFFLSCSAINSL